MKLVLILSTFVLSLFALTPNQISTIQYVYNKCIPYDLQNSCAAIALVESDAGIYQVSTDYSDFGIMQINLQTHLRHLQLPNTPFNRSRVSTRLITDIDYNIEWAINELLFWKSLHNDNWLLIWGSYNGGFSPNLQYAQKVADTIKYLKQQGIIK